MAPSGSKWCKYFSTSRHIQPQYMWHQVRVFLTSGVFQQYFVTIFSFRKMKILICFVLKILRNIKKNISKEYPNKLKDGKQKNQFKILNIYHFDPSNNSNRSISFESNTRNPNNWGPEISGANLYNLDIRALWTKNR